MLSELFDRMPLGELWAGAIYDDNTDGRYLAKS